MVLLIGFEPIRCFQQGILSPWRLPIPPQEHKSWRSSITTGFSLCLWIRASTSLSQKQASFRLRQTCCSVKGNKWRQEWDSNPQALSGYQFSRLALLPFRHPAIQCSSNSEPPAALRLILSGAVRVNRHPSCAVLAIPRPLAICSSIPSCQCLKVPRGHLRRCYYSHLATGLNSSGSLC